MKTGNVHKQRHTIISTIVIISVVNLQSSVHRESSKNDSNMLACCMVFTVSQSGSGGSREHGGVGSRVKNTPEKEGGGEQKKKRTGKKKSSTE